MKKEFKIAIVAELLVRLGGAERVVKEFLELFPNADLFTLIYDEEKCGKVFPKEKVKSSWLQKLPKFLRRRYRFLLPLMPIAIEGLDLMEYDLVISSSSAFAHGVLTSSSAKHVSYCHSPMRYAWDYTHEYLEENRIFGVKKFLLMLVMKKIRMWDQVAAERADLYVVNSEHVKKRVLKYFRKDALVVYPPVDIENFKVSERNDVFFLVISNLSKYKKIEILIEACIKSGEKLVVIGEGSEKKNLEEMAKNIQNEMKLKGEMKVGNVQFLGRQSDEVCKDYLERCSAVAQMNEEDFGISMVEAMACGKPVLAYEVGGSLEIVKDGVNGVLIKENSVEEVILGIRKIKMKNWNGKKIRESVLRFGKEEFRKKFMAVISSVMKNYKTS